MTKYRKLVEAEQWFDGKEIPGVCRPEDRIITYMCLNVPHVHTENGVCRLDPGDYIVVDDEGNFIVMEAKTFEATHDKAI